MSGKEGGYLVGMWGRCVYGMGLHGGWYRAFFSFLSLCANRVRTPFKVVSVLNLYLYCLQPLKKIDCLFVNFMGLKPYA